MTRRTAVLGFDGMDAALVRKWSAAGLLPTFARLLGTCVVTQFDLPPDHSSGMVWPAINTGLPPESHQSYFGTRLIEGTYRLRPRRADDLRGVPYWQKIAACGHRIVLMDVPFSRVDASCGGRQIVGWGQHEWEGRRESHPAGLLEQMERRFGRYPVTPTVEDVWAQGGADALLRLLLQGIERRTRILRHLAEPGDWDFLYAVFHEAHGAGHQFWHLSDPTHPRFDADVLTRTGNALLKVYVALDRSLADLLVALGNDTTVMIILSHGMGPNYNGNHLFPELLARFNRQHGHTSTSVPRMSAAQCAWNRVVVRMPQTFRQRIQRHVPLNVRRWLSAKRRQHSAAWRRAPAFALPGLDGFAAVRVNLRGREPDGKVGAGDEYEAFLTALQSEIESWTIVNTGHKAVARIHRAGRGTETQLGVAPDLLIWWSKAGPIEAIRSPALGTVTGTSPEQRTGEHVMHALVLLRHAHAAHARIDLSGVGLRDIAPTLLALTGTR